VGKGLAEVLAGWRVLCLPPLNIMRYVERARGQAGGSLASFCKRGDRLPRRIIALLCDVPPGAEWRKVQCPELGSGGDSSLPGRAGVLSSLGRRPHLSKSFKAFLQDDTWRGSLSGR
jgi:hypothetical protein